MQGYKCKQNKTLESAPPVGQLIYYYKNLFLFLIEGAAFGVARLQHQYNLEPDSYFKEGVVETNLNLKHVRSKESIRKFTSDDLFQISMQSKSNGLVTTAIDSLKCAIGKTGHSKLLFQTSCLS